MGRLSFSYDAAAADEALSGDTIGTALAKTVHAHPDVDAVVSRHQGIRLSYGQLGEEVEAVARGLLKLGIETGDRVGIWAPTCVEWTLLQFACARVGAILVNVNPAYRPNELAYALRHSGVRLLVTARSFKTSDYLAMLAGVRAELPQLERVVTIDGEAAGGPKDLPWPAMVELGAGISADQVREREIAARHRRSRSTSSTRAARPATRRAPRSRTTTSSTTRNRWPARWATPASTGCASRCRSTTASGWASATSAASPPGRRWCIRRRASTPSATLEAIGEERCTSIYGVPTMFIAMLEHPRFAEFDLSALRTGIMAGAPCPVEVMKRVVDEMHAAEITIGYGMTETAPVSFDDPARGRTSTAESVDGRHRHARTSRARSSIRPRVAPCPIGDPGRGVRARLPRHARATGTTRRRRRRPSMTRLDAHRRPRRDGRRRATSTSSGASRTW